MYLFIANKAIKPWKHKNSFNILCKRVNKYMKIRRRVCVCNGTNYEAMFTFRCEYL